MENIALAAIGGFDEKISDWLKRSNVR